MSKLFLAASATALWFFSSATAVAQVFIGPQFFPGRLTSSDRLVLVHTNLTCGGALPYIANPYTVQSAGGRITVTAGRRESRPVPTCPPAPVEQMEIGVLPPGDYLLTLQRYREGTDILETVFADFGFTVTDARASKVAPYVRLDYSGTWWDPNDPGWGLFVWQNAASPSDELLAAWFTFGTDGRANWYTFQPTWSTSSATNSAALVQSSRPPSNANPPPGPNTGTNVGTASLDFTPLIPATRLDTAVLAYTIGSGARQTRTIQRFRP
jgi:hypothetical protein